MRDDTEGLFDKPFCEVTEEDWSALVEERDELRAQLSRAEIEHHYRIVHNLQVMYTFLDLILIDAPESVPRDHVRAVQRAIMVLRISHDAAVAAGVVEAYSAKAVLDRVMQALSGRVGAGATWEIADVLLPFRYCTSLALILAVTMEAMQRAGGIAVVVLTRRDVEATLHVTSSVHIEGGHIPHSFGDPDGDLVGALAKQDLGGTVRFESAPGFGSRLTVDFPIHCAVGTL